jgi:hypothetical protein
MVVVTNEADGGVGDSTGLVINAEGDVGIGNSPSYALDVSGGEIYARDISMSRYLDVGGASNLAQLAVKANGVIPIARFITSGSVNALELKDSGTLGLGTSSPSSHVHIHTDSPAADSTIFNISTSDDISRFSVDEDGDVSVDGTIEQDSLTTEAGVDTLADDGETVFATGVAGWGQVMAGDNEEWAQFRFTSAGVVTLIDNSTNVANSDSDTDLCIYDAGSGIAIKNRLGSSKNVAYKIEYFSP